MFELIRANKRRSWLLIMFMLCLLLLLGFAIGSAAVPTFSAAQYNGQQLVFSGLIFDPLPGFVGMGVAFSIWLVQCLVAYYQGGRILLNISGATEIEHSDHPQLFNVVEEMAIAAGLPKPPKVYLIDDMAMNAFATGRDEDHAAVAVTAGLLGRMDRDQLQGVIAHEIAHIVHRDVLYMTLAGIMVGTIIMLSDAFLRGLRHGSRFRSSRSKKGGGGGQLIVLLIALVLAILAPILAQMLYFACSRRREYLADAGAAVYTRYPEGLASALESIAGDAQPVANVTRATAPMYIANPFQSGGLAAFSLFQTHPPIEERVRILRGMAGGVSYGAYQTAWKKNGGDLAQMPPSAMGQPMVPIREPNRTQNASRQQRQRMREAGDLLRKVNQFLFLSCVCGLRLKLPPELRQKTVACPRCHRPLEIPMAQPGNPVAHKEANRPVPADGIPMAKVKQAPPTQELVHQGAWVSYRCQCGADNSLSPSFSGVETICPRCGTAIPVRNANSHQSA